MENKNSSPVVNVKIPKVLIEILVYGEKKDQEKIERYLKDLQEQMYTKDAVKKVRIFFKVDNGEETIEEKKKGLIENCKSKYYVFGDCEKYNIEKDFVKKILSKIKKFETAFTSLKESGVMVSKIKPEESKEIKMEVLK